MTLTKDDEIATKVITILAKEPFDFSDDLDKISILYNSIKLKAFLNDAVGTKTVGQTVTAQELGITIPATLAEGITVTYVVQVIYNNSERGVIYVTGTLTKDYETATKEIMIIAKEPFDFNDDLAKIASTATSSKMHSVLTTDVGAKEIDAAVTATELGLTEQAFSEGVTASYIVKTKYVEETEIIVVTATLAKAGATAVTKIITINAKEPYNFSRDLAKILSTATSSKNKNDLMTNVGSKEIDEVVSAEELGVAEIAFSDGVTVAYNVKIKYVSTTGIIVVTATLSKHGETAVTKEITITAVDNPFDFSDQLARLNDFTSLVSKEGLGDLNHYGAKKVGDSIFTDYIGFSPETDPSFSQGVSDSYHIVVPLNLSTGQMTFKLTLAKNNIRVSKNIVVTARDA